MSWLHVKLNDFNLRRRASEITISARRNVPEIISKLFQMIIAGPVFSDRFNVAEIILK